MTRVTQVKKAKKIEGFSKRFNQLLDAINFPSYGRYTEGAKVIGKTLNVFKEYCTGDTGPRTKEALVDTVKALLRYRGALATVPAESIAAWLYFGDDIVPNPLTQGEKPSAAEIMRLAGICNNLSQTLGFTFTDLDEVLIQKVLDQLVQQCRAYNTDILKLNSSLLPSGIEALALELLQPLVTSSANA